MRPALLEDFRCPNTGSPGFEVYAHELRRDGRLLQGVAAGELRPDDEIKTGLVVHPDTGYAFPIEGYVLSLLADPDVDRRRYRTAFELALTWDAAAGYANLLHERLARLPSLPVSSDGLWNQEEMVYYDAAVETAAQRAAFLARIREQPLYHIYSERAAHLVEQVKWRPEDRVLEIGCGNARTLAWLAPPAHHGYAYLGTDISLKRLMLAKEVIPEGDFVQCSALNLPFREEAFSKVISFGMLHHLPDPIRGVAESMGKLRAGGQYLLHEPIEKPRKVLPEGQYRWLKQVLTTYEHSSHDNEVDLEGLEALLYGRGRVEYRHVSGSILRTLLVRLITSFSGLLYNERAWHVVFRLDQCFLRLFRGPTLFGPKAVFMVFTKEGLPVQNAMDGQLVPQKEGAE